MKIQSLDKKVVHYRMAPTLSAWIIVSHSRESLIGFPIGGLHMTSSKT